MPWIAYFLNVGIGGSPDIPLKAFDAHPPGPSSPPPHCCPGGDSVLPQRSRLELGPKDSPSIKGVLPGDDVSAIPAHEELDAVVEGVQVLLGHRGLCLLDDVQWVRGAQAQWVDMTEGLEAAVGVHAVHQAICRGDRA